MWIRYAIVAAIVAVQVGVYFKARQVSDAVRFVQRVSKSDQRSRFFTPHALQQLHEALACLPSSTLQSWQVEGEAWKTDEAAVGIYYETFPILPSCIYSIKAAQDTTQITLLFQVGQPTLVTISLLGKGDQIKINNIAQACEQFRLYQ